MTHSPDVTNATEMPDNTPHLLEANQEPGSWLRRVLWFLFWAALAASIAAAVYVFFFQKEEKSVLTVAAGEILSDSHTLLREVAEVVERHSETLELVVSATGSASSNITELNAGKYDLAVIRESTPVVADVRMIADLFPDYFQLIARSDRYISSFQSLGGKHIVIPPYGTEENRFFFIILDHFDISTSSFTWEALPLESAISMLLSGDADAFFTVRSLRDRRILRFFEDSQLKKLRLDYVPVEQADAIALKRPFLTKGVIPKGAFVGSNPTPLQDVETARVTRVLVSRENVDPEAIRELTRVLFENRLDLTIRFALATAISAPQSAAGTAVPLHEGAQAYYDRDQPSFLQENAEPIALMITIAAMLGSGLLALRGRLTAKQKNRLDHYNYDLLAIAERARIETNIPVLNDMKTELFGILETVVRALDTDEVTEEGFQSFSLLWESVRETIREQIDRVEKGAAV